MVHVLIVSLSHYPMRADVTQHAVTKCHLCVIQLLVQTYSVWNQVCCVTHITILQYMSYKGAAPFDEQQAPEKLYPFSSCLAVTTCLPKDRSWYPNEQLLHLTYAWSPHMNTQFVYITRPHQSILSSSKLIIHQE